MRLRSFALVTLVIFVGCKPRNDSASQVRFDHNVTGPYKDRSLGNADYILALDLDETLLYQGSDVMFADLRNVVQDDIPNEVHVKFTPHADEMIRCRYTHCRGVYINTVKRDDAATDILKKWIIDGKPVFSDWLMGTLTRDHNYLGQDLVKDLRKIDPTLEHVVLVDDNPRRVMQKELLRAVPKFSAPMQKSVLGQKRPVALALNALYDGMLQQAMADINDAAAAAEESGKTFAYEFRKFSYASYANPADDAFDANLAETMKKALYRAGVNADVAETIIKDPRILKPRSR